MKALRVSGSSIQVCASTMPEATIVFSRALTIAHQRPSVTTPMGTAPVRSSSSIRSIGLAAHPSPGGSRSESTGSTTMTSAPIVPSWTSAPSASRSPRSPGSAPTPANPGPVRSV